MRPPTNAPIAIPPKKPVRIVETAWVVLPKTRTSWRDQTTSYMSPAAPDRTKIARTSRGCLTPRVSHAAAAVGSAEEPVQLGPANRRAHDLDACVHVVRR